MVGNSAKLTSTFTATITLGIQAGRSPFAILPDFTAQAAGPTSLTVQLTLSPQSSLSEEVASGDILNGPQDLGPAVPFMVGIVPFLCQPYWDVPGKVTLSAGAPFTYTLTATVPGTLVAQYAFVDGVATTTGDGFTFGQPTLAGVSQSVQQACSLSAMAQITPTFGLAISIGKKIFGLSIGAQVFTVSLPLSVSAAAVLQSPPDASFTTCPQCRAMGTQASLTGSLATQVSYRFQDTYIHTSGVCIVRMHPLYVRIRY